MKRREEDAMTVYEQRCRASVSIFAEAMLRKMLANEHKGLWIDERPDYMISRLQQEVEDMKRDPSIEEAADVANFAMMWAEVARGAI